MRVRIRIVFAAVAILAATVVSLPANAAELFVVGGSRPVTVQLPADTSQPSPLLVMLHSASTSGAHKRST